MKKVLYTLAVDNYAPEITALTFPLMQTWARKIGADFHVITERRFPEWPAPCEKLQIFELAKANRADWHLFLDADALVHPHMFDVTEHIGKETVLHHATDMASVRFDTGDRFFRRDGRRIAPGNWCTIASDWNIELWEPPTDLTLAEIAARIHQTVPEIEAGVQKSHLADDFILARNVAKYGLKVDTLLNVFAQLKLQPVFFWHDYLHDRATKVRMLQQTLAQWGLA